MAFLKLTSDNKNLSWVIEKNPETGIVIKSNRQGYLFGYYPLGEINSYCVYFKDVSDEVSYKKHPDESFDYLSSSKYTNARFINDSIEEMLKSARDGIHTYQKEGKEYDVDATHALVINVIETQFKTIDIFQKHFKELAIISTEVTKNNYRVLFKNLIPMTLSKFLNIVNLFGIFAVLNSSDFTYLQDGMIEKYLRILNKIDAPYFIRYLFKVRLLRSEARFNKLKESLESTTRHDKLTMTYGDTHDARIEWIKSHVKTETNSIVDIGTGIDFRYLKMFAPKLQEKNLNYYAIEKDFDAIERIKVGIKNRQLDNVELFESLENFILLKPPDLQKQLPPVIICTEVLEHNEINEVEGILKKIFENIDFSQLLITVPNASFNKHFGLEGFRHDDHKWEYTREQFVEFMGKIIGKFKHFHYSVYDIGDNINGDAVSTGIIVSKL